MATENGHLVMPDHPVVLPAWFVKVMAVIGTLFIPWFTYVTVQIVTINVKLDVLAKSDDRASTLHDHFQSHIGDPDIHQSGFRAVTSRIDALEQRVQRVEKQDP